MDAIVFMFIGEEEADVSYVLAGAGELKGVGQGGRRNRGISQAEGRAVGALNGGSWPQR